jgi:hypothetical protein
MGNGIGIGMGMGMAFYLTTLRNPQHYHQLLVKGVEVIGMGSKHARSLVDLQVIYIYFFNSIVTTLVYTLESFAYLILCSFSFLVVNHALPLLCLCVSGSRSVNAIINHLIITSNPALKTPLTPVL